MVDLTPDTIAQFSRKGVLVDANLLFLLILGFYDRSQIPRNPRTREYVEEDFDLLVELLGHFQRIITVPNVLTEVSNLSTKFDNARRLQFLEHFRCYISALDERYVESKVASVENEFARIGLTDTVIALVAAQKNLVLTADLGLYRHLMYKGLAAINFNHIRAQGWIL